MKDKDNKNKLINLIFTLYDNDCVSLNDIYDAFYTLLDEPFNSWANGHEQEEIKEYFLEDFRQQGKGKHAYENVTGVLDAWQKEGYTFNKYDIKEFGLARDNKELREELEIANEEFRKQFKETKESMQMLTTDYRLLSTMVNNMESRLMDKADKMQEITGENPLLEDMNKKYSD